jgi:hypothetical protein
MNSTNVCSVASDQHTILDIFQGIAVLLCSIMLLSLCVIMLYLILWYSEGIPVIVWVMSLNIFIIGALKDLTVFLYILLSSLAKVTALFSHGCGYIGPVHDGILLARVLLSLVICIDRFLSVFKPGFYKRHIHGIGLCYVVSLWGVVAVYAVGLQWLPDCFRYVPSTKTCSGFSGCPGCKAYSTVFLVAFIVIAVLVPVLCYPILFNKCRKSQQGVSRPQEEIFLEEEEVLTRQEREQQLLRRLREEEVEQVGEAGEGVENESVVELQNTANCMLKWLLASTVIFFSMDFIIGFLEQQGVDGPSYWLQVLILAPFSYLAPIFDLLVVLCNYQKKVSEVDSNRESRPLTPFWRLLKNRRDRMISIPVPQLPNLSPTHLPLPPSPTLSESGHLSLPSSNPTLFRAYNPPRRRRRRHLLTSYVPTLSPIMECVKKRETEM